MWKFFLPSGNSMTADLKQHPEKPGGEISDRGTICPSLGQPKRTKQWITTISELMRAANPHWVEHIFSHTTTLTTSMSTTNTHVFKELGQPKVGHVLKPKGKLSRPQLSCSQPEDKSDSLRGTGGFRNLTCDTWNPSYHEPSAFWKEQGLKAAVKATKLCRALLYLSQLWSVSVSTMGLRDDPAGWRESSWLCWIFFYSSDFTHLTMTHSIKHIVHHNPAHPMHVYIYIYMINSSFLETLTFTCCDILIISYTISFNVCWNPVNIFHISIESWHVTLSNPALQPTSCVTWSKLLKLYASVSSSVKWE